MVWCLLDLDLTAVNSTNTKSAQPDLNLTWIDLIRLNFSQLDSNGPESTWVSSTWPDLTRLWLGSTQPNLTHLDLTRVYLISINSAKLDSAKLNLAWLDLTWLPTLPELNETFCCVAATAWLHWITETNSRWGWFLSWCHYTAAEEENKASWQWTN